MCSCLSLNTIPLRTRSHYDRRVWKRRFHSTTPEEFQSATINGHFGFVFEENSDRKSRDYRDVIIFRPHENEKPMVWNSSGFDSVSQKLRFRDGLVWTAGKTIEMNLRFQISPARCRRYLNQTVVIKFSTILMCLSWASQITLEIKTLSFNKRGMTGDAPDRRITCL